MRRLTLRNVINKTLQPVDLKLVKVGRQPSTQAHKILFIHVPKCGGSSVIDGIQSAFGLEASESRRAPFRLDDTAMNATTRHFAASGPELNRFLLRYALERPGSNYVAGHFLFDNAAFTGFEADWSRLTTLRAPRKHILSMYYFNRHKKGSRDHTTDLEIEEWLDSPGARGGGRAFVRIFVGDPEISARFHEVGLESEIMEEAIVRAERNLDSFTIVGDSGDMAAFERMIADKLGVSVQFDRINTSPAKAYPRFDEHSATVREKIDAVIMPNQRIYDRFFGAT